MSSITTNDLSELLECVKRFLNARLGADPDEIDRDEDALIRVMRRCLQSDVTIADDDVDRHLDAVLRASGSALRHYTMQKSLDDMRAAMRAAMLPVPLFDSQCRELCAALGWQGGTYHKVLAEVKRLKAADPAPHAGLIRELLNIARLAWLAVDDSEEIETADGRGHVISDVDFDALTQALDELDELPDDQPGVTMNAPMKAAWALRSMLAEAAGLATYHPDDSAVDEFARAMKLKLEKKRAEGRGGWQDKYACPAAHLQTLLLDHLSKGDPVDIGNFAMMLFNRGDKTIGPAGFTTSWHLDESASSTLFHLAHPNDDGEHPELTLRLGYVRDDDGAVRYGLLSSLADYPEEGATLLAECSEPQPSPRSLEGEIDLLRWVSDDITRLIKEGRGAWRSCSGCHELNEGHDTGPYSSTFRCALGRGCSECGGIGAVWDTTDYQALADAQKGGV